IHCPNCSTRLRGKAGKEYFHAMLGATLVAPGHDKVVPLQPEFIVPQDGAEKQDCENAAKRWLDAHAAGYARLNPIYLGDDLFSRQPQCEAVLAAGSHFIFVCKPSSHPLIAEYLAGIELATRQDRVKRGKTHDIFRYRWLNDVPLRGGRMPSRSTGLKSRSSIAMARSPTATVSLPTCRWAPIMSPNSRPAVALAGRSRTRPSTFSRPRDTTSSTISVTASTTSPPSW